MYSWKQRHHYHRQYICTCTQFCTYMYMYVCTYLDFCTQLYKDIIYSVHVHSIYLISLVVPINGVSEKPPPSSWYEDLLPEDLANNIELSGKLVFLLELLKEAEKVHEKVLVFSQSLLILNMIEEFIQSPQGGEFIEGINYFRLDGSTKADDRLDFMKRFNNKSSVSSDRYNEYMYMY